MEKTIDNLILEKSEDNDNDMIERPFIRKELVRLPDTNASHDYNRNQVEFQTNTIANNGLYCDYREAICLIPCVGRINRTAGPNLSQDEALKAFQMKSSYLNLIDSMIVKYANGDTIQQNANISPYLVFKQHMEMSQDDVNVNSHFGYRKDDSESWFYSANVGMCNNVMHDDNSTDSIILYTTNKSIKSDFKNYNTLKSPVMTNTVAKTAGINTIEQDGDSWVYYFNFEIRLKDIPFFQNMKLTRGANLSIIFNMNQAETTMIWDGAAYTSVTNNLKGSVNPMMRADITDVTDGSLPPAFTEVMSLKVVTNGTKVHNEKTCSLIIPVYQMKPNIDSRYSGGGKQKTIMYEDVYVKHIRNMPSGSQISETLATSMAGAKQLIIIPMLSRSANGAFNITPQESVFASEPSTCSPYFIRDFNVHVAHRPMYNNNSQYKYQTFMMEMNGSLGANANLDMGQTSGQINFNDYLENYGYLVCDLSRRYDYDEKVPIQISITGTIDSPKDLDLLCFVTYNKAIVIDVETGNLIVKEDTRI